MKFPLFLLFLFSAAYAQYPIPEGSETCDVASANECPGICAVESGVDPSCHANCMAFYCPGGFPSSSSGNPPGNPPGGSWEHFNSECNGICAVDSGVDPSCHANCMDYYCPGCAPSDGGDGAASSKAMEALVYTLMAAMLLFSFLIGFSAGNR